MPAITRTVEAAATRVAVTEASPFAEAATPAPGPGRLLIRLINVGRGSSGVYPAETLKAAAEARVFKTGTHMHIDHQTDQESYERPEGTLHDLAAVLTEDARWDEDAQALVAEARVYSRYRTMLAEMAPDIGVSIRAYADTAPGEWNGEPARIITRLLKANTVDFVTKAGRGGAIVEILEAARPIQEARNVGQWVESRIHRDFTVMADEMAGDGRLTREERITLSGAIGDALASFVARVEADAPQLYQRDIWEEPPAPLTAAVESEVSSFARASGIAPADTAAFVLGVEALATTGQLTTAAAAEVAGAAVEQFGLTAPAAAPTKTSSATPAEASEAAPAAEPNPPAAEAGSNPPHKKEDPMGSIQVDEARYAGLEEKAGQVPALEQRATAAETRATEAEQRALQAEAGTYARDFARKLVTKANADLAEASVSRIVADAIRGTLPLTEAGRLDTEAFTPVVEKAREEEETYLAQVATESGVGSVRGVGATATAPLVVEADFDKAVARAFGRKEA